MPRFERAPFATVLMAAIAVLAVSAIFGFGAGVAGPMALVGLLGLIVIWVVAASPAVGAYLYLAATPLVAGIARDQVIPILRPNEALLALIATGLAVRGVIAFADGRRFLPRFTRLDGAVAALVFAGAVLPLLWRYAAGDPISGDDVFYAAVFWKYLLLYFTFRVAVRTVSEVRIALWIVMVVTAMVAVIAMLQSLGLFGVPEFLFEYYTAFQGETADIGRGSSTLALSFAVADIMVIGLGIVAGLMRGASVQELRTLAAFGGVFLLGAVAAGQFSGYIGLFVAVLAIAFGLRDRRAATIGLGATLAGGLILWPVVAGRLSGFGNGGVPTSWTGRLDNLRDYVMPELTEGLHWLVGVRPAARIVAPEPWRQYVYIESGYLWLLWTGGLVMMVAFGYLMYRGLRAAWRAIERGPRPITGAGLGTFVGLVVIVVLTLFDPHLTMRGTADLIFPLLAMTLVGVGEPALRPERPIQTEGMVGSR
jgi:hypothetical protein